MLIKYSVPVFILLNLVLNSCFQKVKLEESASNEKDFSGIEIKYAQGFSVLQKDSLTWIIISDPSTGKELDTLDISGSSIKKCIYFNRIIAQSTTHFAFLQKIESLNHLVGLCGIQYLDKQQEAQIHQTVEVCNAQGLEIEKVLATKPDLVFLYPFRDQDRQKLERIGIQTIYLTEYLEKSPLGRAEWLKFFSLVSGQDPNETGFDEIEKEYNAVVQQIKIDNSTFKLLLQQPKTLAFNLPFGDTWDMPSGNSVSAQLAKDAGFDYIFKHENQTGNLIFKLEEAYKHLMEAEYWIIVAARQKDYSLNDLKAENRMYQNFPSVRSNHVFFCNSQTTPYFSVAPIEPHVLLKDLVNCLKSNDMENKYFKILR